ncbi:restriction endonuclease subunit S [Acinetobacter schindleri]|uniref:restriction endonuclease subunit S n=1 Tax=Acinetobacter schindleri TaxID=108981 RepID=UPI003A87940A
MNINLPNTWLKVKLGDICDITYGKGLPTSKLLPEGYPVFGANAVIGYYSEYLYELEKLLISCRGANSGTINMSPPKAFITNNSLVLNFPAFEESLRKLLFFFLQACNKEKLVTGTAQPQVTINNAVELNIHLPPLNEQKRIVQKIEELFSEIDDGIQSLETAKKQLDIYREAILIQAFNGNLTKQWRTLNSDKLPTKEYFLSAINRDREERYEKQVADWNKDLSHWEKAGKIGSKPKKPKPLPRIEATQISTEGLPKGWIKTNLEYVCDFITKGTTPAKNELFAKQGDIPFIKVYNLTHKGYLDFSIDPTFVTKQTHEGFLKRSKVYPNDVLMNIVGPPLGKVSIVPDSYPEWNINQAIAIYRSNLIDSKYLSEFLLNENTVRAMMSQSKATAGQFNLTLEICRNFPIPVCSKLEQAEIVKSLSENLSNAQYLQETIDQQLEQLMLLKQTVLQTAFSGELVPQDPNDEPASVLLERIKAEKEEELAKAKANKAPKKPTKRKTKATKKNEPAQQELI